MKHTFGYVFLLALAGILAFSYWRHRQRAEEQKKSDAAAMLALSNHWTETRFQLDEAHGVITNLQQDIVHRDATLRDLTNDLTLVTSNLALTRSDLETARKRAQEDIAKRDARIADLEAQNLNLDRHAMELTNAITELNAQIADTRRKLATAEGDKAFLQNYLQRLIAEKAELEKKFNDIEVVRAQLKNLKENLVIARRSDWIRRGIYATADRKGAELLVTKGPLTQTPPNLNSNYDLNAEIGSDGKVRIIPPGTKPATNDSVSPR